MRHTFPSIEPAAAVSPSPKSANAPLAEAVGEPSMGSASYDRLLTARLASIWLPTGTVDSTSTPGAASSTSAFDCEKDACLLLESTAATDTTLGNPAG